MLLYQGDQVRFVLNNTPTLGTIVWFELENNVRCVYVDIGNDECILVERALLTPTRIRHAE